MTANADDTSIHPFRIAISEPELEDLRDRLARTRWPDEAPIAGWDYGIPLGYVRELADYWRTIRAKRSDRPISCRSKILFLYFELLDL